MPLLTRLMFTAFAGTKDNFLWIVMGIVLLFVGMRLLRWSPRARYALDALQVRAPIVGGVVIASELSRFSRTMATLLEAGVPLATCLHLAVEGCKNQIIKRTFQTSEESLISGQGFTSTFKKHPILPLLFVELAMIGEASNSLRRTMRDAATAYQKEFEQRIDGVLAMLEPVSTLVVGAIVAVMAFSMLMPIYAGLQSFK
ncbi:MAG: type II secretion system F family protein [Chloroflexi bacterium]|nr:type II secretion system F family protein [Chloroflexota bacterium]